MGTGVKTVLLLDASSYAFLSSGDSSGGNGFICFAMESKHRLRGRVVSGQSLRI